MKKEEILKSLEITENEKKISDKYKKDTSLPEVEDYKEFPNFSSCYVTEYEMNRIKATIDFLSSKVDNFIQNLNGVDIGGGYKKTLTVIYYDMIKLKEIYEKMDKDYKKYKFYKGLCFFNFLVCLVCLFLFVVLFFN